MNLKNIPFSIILLLLTTTTYAQFGAEHPIFKASGLNSGQSHYVMDMDHDADQDIVMLRADKKLSLLRNDGTGHFAEGEIIAEHSYDPPYIVDFNHDSLPDVVVQCADNFSCWMLNNGDGTFNNSIPIDDIYILKVLDMNNDGEMDIFYSINDAGSQTLSYYWLENEGSGIFIQQHFLIYDSGFNDIYFPFLQDFNADGLPDFAFYPYFLFDDLTWIPLQQNGTLSQTEAHSLIMPLNFYREFADLDYDGDLDYLESPAYSLLWYANDGNGNFSLSDTLFNMFNTGSEYLIVDVNGDGYVDVMNNTNSGLAWSENDGHGNFTVKTSGVPYNSTWKFADISGDGLGDIVFIHGAALNHGAGGFGPVESYFPEVVALGSSLIADADHDGDSDVFFTDIDKREMGWFRNDGTGAFPEKNILQSSFNGGLFVADFDADGDPDLAGSEIDSIQLIWQGEPDGNYGAPDTIVRNVMDAYIYEMIDIDNDSDLDWHVYSYPQAPVYINGWMYNDGNGNFSDPMPPSISPLGYVDIDADGLLDLIYSNIWLLETYWQKNLGNGSFGNLDTIGSYATFSAQGADLDQDGDNDLLIGGDMFFNGQQYYFFWLENQNNGTAWVEHPIGYLKSDIFCLGDFNLDGTIDICASELHNMSPDTFNINWYANDGAGNFGSPIFMEQHIGVKTLAPADFDQDGDLDVLYSGYTGIGWFENLAANPVINGICFFDANENGMHDITENPLPGIKIHLEPTGQTTFSAADGTFRFYASAGDFSLSAEAGDCFETTTSPATFQIQLPLPTSDSLFAFGFKNQTGQPNMVAPISAGPTRCGFNVPFWISLQNEGCFPAAAVFSLQTNGLVSFVSAEPAPALVQGDSLVWHSGDSLQPGEIRTIRALLKVAGTDHLGDTIKLTGLAWAVDPSGNLLQPPATSFFASEINCAYDPNDKSVNRTTVPADYDPATSELTYTIRFQNTGTDTAFNVRLLDTLAAELDWATFRPLGASHPNTITLDEISGAVEYRLDNILLPDSTINEPASHGFVSFSILMKPDLPSGTSVSNMAAIYFDFNPPVFTNTVATEVQPPASASSEPKRGWQIQISPNPNSGIFTVELPEPATADMFLRINDLSGRILFQQPTELGSSLQSVFANDLPAGMYFLQVRSEGRILAVDKLLKQ